MSQAIKSIPDQAFFHVVTRSQPIDVLIANLYLQPSQLTKDHFLSVNQHLKASVKPGQIVIITPPGQTECTVFEATLADMAAKYNQALQNFNADDVNFINQHYTLLSNIMSYGGAANGLMTSYFGKNKKQLELLLQQLERLYVNTYNKTGGLKQQLFYQKRKAIFNSMNAVLSRMAGKKTMGINLQAGNLKNSLGLSTKNIIHQWNQMPGHVETIPDFADNHAQLMKYGKYVKGLGYASVLLDVGNSGLIIREACSKGREQECTKSKYAQGGRIVGSVGGGAVSGYLASYGLCNLFFGFPSAGTSFLWCSVVAGGAGG